MPTNLKLVLVSTIILGIFIVGMQIRSNKNQIIDSFITNLNTESVDSIDLVKAGQTKSISKNSKNKWSYSEEKNKVVDADGNKVKNLLQSIHDIKKDLIVSHDQNKQSIFEVNKKGLEVKLFQNKQKIIDFFVGKTGSSWDSEYFRLADSDEIIQYNKNLSYIFSQDFKASPPVKKATKSKPSSK